MHEFPVLGWDIGGAHLKAVLVDRDGCALQAIQLACPLWRGLSHLDHAIAQVLSGIAVPVSAHAVTMSGELADIFPDRSTGVAHIIETLSSHLETAPLRIYAGRLGFVSPGQAAAHAVDVGSANWHASAAWLARQIDSGLMIDLGSTTADLCVLQGREVLARGFSDADRMRHGELLYTGVVRTPVMAVAQALPFEGEWQHVAAEHFATMADVYRLTGELPEACDMAPSADGQGKTPEDSARRLARMVGRDLQDASMPCWAALAGAVRARQLTMLEQAAMRLLSRGQLAADAPVVGAGAGRFLLAELARRLGRRYVDAESLLGVAPETAAWASVCFPAYATAALGVATS